MKQIPQGKWVEIEQVVLQSSERAPQVPDDTRSTQYMLRVCGFLENPADLGTEATVCTLIGRKLKGKIINANPAYTHSFGPTVEELLKIGKEEISR